MLTEMENINCSRAQQIFLIFVLTQINRIYFYSPSSLVFIKIEFISSFFKKTILISFKIHINNICEDACFSGNDVSHLAQRYYYQNRNYHYIDGIWWWHRRVKCTYEYQDLEPVSSSCTNMLCHLFSLWRCGGISSVFLDGSSIVFPMPWLFLRRNC